MGPENNETISIGEFLRYCLKHWLLSVAIVVTAVVAAVAYVQIQPAKYQSTAKFIVLGDSRQQSTSRDIVLGNYVALITSNRVLSKVQEDQPDLNVNQIRDNIVASRDKTNEIITVDFTSTESDRAASVIESTISRFQEVVTEMYGVAEDGVNIISAPTDSGRPVNKSVVTPVMMSVAGGLAVALVVAFLRFDAEQRKATKLDELDEAEKRQKRKAARDAEKVRREKVAAELKEIEARKVEAEERVSNAQHRIARIDLAKMNTEISKAEKLLKIAEVERKSAESATDKAKAEATKVELELQSLINEINVAEEKKIARRQSANRVRTARLEARINSKTDAEIIRIRAQKRIEAERAARVAPIAYAAKETLENVPKAEYNNATDQVAGHRVSGASVTAVQPSIVKRPLGER